VAKYKLTGKAKKDLLDIIEYTQKQWGRSQTRIYIDRIEERCQMLADNPSIGRDMNEIAPGLLSYPVESHVVYYKRQGDDIFVIRVLHKRMLADKHR